MQKALYIENQAKAMAKSAAEIPTRKHRAFLLATLFLFSLMSMAAQAADSDGDGVEDSLDDCPWAAGTSTVDSDGCPDQDGDGTSDYNDGWVILLEPHELQLNPDDKQLMENLMEHDEYVEYLAEL